jgi:predicted transcriptional regulator
VSRKNTQGEGDAATLPAKEEVRRLLERLPDDASLEDIQYHIYVRQKILRGFEDVEAGRTLSEDEFEARLSKWLEP